MKLEDIPMKKGQLNKLRSRGITTIEELLSVTPRKYIDCRKDTGFAAPPEESILVMRLNTVKTYPATIHSRHTTIVKAIGTEASSGANVSITWFNQEWMYAQAWEEIGRTVLVYGQAVYNSRFKTYEITCPKLFTENTAAARRIYPVYSKISGIAEATYESYVKTALAQFLPSEPLDEAIRSRYALPTMYETYHYLHEPQIPEQIEQGRRRLEFNDLLDFSLCLEYIARKSSKGSPYQISSMALYRKILASLPYALTSDQESACKQMLDLVASGRRLNALIQGDVGCGKTLVAQLITACFVGSGYQVALMAPTQILAKQHYRDFQKLFEPLSIKVIYVDSSAKKSEQKKVAEEISSGEASVIIGTSGILSEKLQYKELALCITDEEHRFGVTQREALAAKGNKGVHYISMSATPIPRTLAGILYGEQMQLINIFSMPPGRKPVKTGVAKSRAAIYAFLKKQAAIGRQAYVVCPLVEKSDSDAVHGVKSVAEIYTEFTMAPELHGLRIACLTGATRKKDAEAIIDAFSKGEIDILVATSIVEVGVNVPNATTIIIENAERFGLSSLHQLRGRVGRGNGQGYCVLESDHRTGIAGRRMKALCEISSGFALAEIDLQLRGGGELYGQDQSGKNKYLELALAKPELLQQAKEAAKEMFDNGYEADESVFNNL